MEAVEIITEAIRDYLTTHEREVPALSAYGFLTQNNLLSGLAEAIDVALNYDALLKSYASLQEHLQPDLEAELVTAKARIEELETTVEGLQQDNSTLETSLQEFANRGSK